MIADSKLERLLQCHGIASEFIAFSGETIQTPLEHRVTILSALGVAPCAEAEVDRMLNAMEAADWLQLTSRVHVLEEGHESIVLAIAIADDSLEMSLQWQLCPEHDSKLSGSYLPAEHLQQDPDTRVISGRAYSRHWLPLPPLKVGYHQLYLQHGEKQVKSLLIVSPSRCHEPQWLREGKRLWGVSVQLYTLQSDSDRGIGDLGDLRQLLDSFARQGADFVLLNPLHALDNRYPDNASPYSPADRRFLNPLYLHVEAVDEFALCGDIRAPSDEVRDLCSAELVNYPLVFALKYRIFEQLFLAFRETHLRPESARGREFRQWQQSLGEAGLRFAEFQSRFPVEGIAIADEPDFHLYLQWQTEQQLRACQQLALSAGMKLGLIRDLAVGSGEDSCEVTTNPALFCMGARIGAPPDNFNPDGQNWGLPPLRPQALVQHDFSHFIALLRSNMKHCGALRIDHVMALMRLWWCPTDGSNAAGAYVHYPVQALFAILRLESQRARVVVIGEDLGVVPPQIRAYLDHSGLLSNVMFYFEKYDGWHFRRPQDYRQKALAVVANHDVPTLSAWWNGSDIVLRRRLGLIRSDEDQSRESAFRHQERQLVLDLLADLQILPAQWQRGDTERSFDPALGQAIFRFCGMSASQLVSVQLDDIAGLETPVNIPGTSAEYANWRRRIPLPVPELLLTEQAQTLLQGLCEVRP